MSPAVRTFFFERPLQAGIFEIRGREARHIRGSLRLKPGDEIALIDGSGRKARAEILSAYEERVKVRVFTVEEGKEAATRLTLAVSVPKERRMDWLIEKCTELGVGGIVPTVFRNSVVRPREGRHGKAEKWERVALEAAKQSGRPSLPVLSEFMNFHEVLDLEADLRVLLSPDASVPLASLLDGDAPSSALVIVGPEGGADVSEEKAALDKGFRKARLTDFILRIETAAVAAAAVVLARPGAAEGREGPS